VAMRALPRLRVADGGRWSKAIEERRGGDDRGCRTDKQEEDRGGSR
jgi:hypothetical protein